MTKRLLFSELLAILLEGALEFYICGYLNISQYFTTTMGEWLGIILSFSTFSLCVVVLPILAIWTIFKSPVSSFREVSYRRRWRVLIEGIRIRTKGQRAFIFVFLLRRLLFCITAFNNFFNQARIYQILSLLGQNLAMIIYSGMVYPLTTRQDNKVESFNQLMLAFSCFHVFLYTDFVPDSSMQYDLGWSLIMFFGIIVVVNFYFIVGMLINIVKLLCILAYRHINRYLENSKREE